MKHQRGYLSPQPPTPPRERRSSISSNSSARSGRSVSFHDQITLICYHAKQSIPLESEEMVEVTGHLNLPVKLLSEKLPPLPPQKLKSKLKQLFHFNKSKRPATESRTNAIVLN